MNKTEETELLKEARENISWWLNNGNPKSNFVEHAFNTTTNILHQIDEHLAQSQCPDKEQSKELEEMLDKEFPLFDTENVDKITAHANNILNIEILHKREKGTKFFLSGKGAQGRETISKELKEYIVKLIEQEKDSFELFILRHEYDTEPGWKEKIPAAKRKIAEAEKFLAELESPNT